MIPGARASLTVARTPDEVRSTLERQGWPWLGRPGALAAREVDLDGQPAQPFHVRVFMTPGAGRNGTTWRLRLERPGVPMSSEGLLDLQLSMEELGKDGARLQLEGRAAPDLLSSGTVNSESDVRRVAMAYTRSLLEQIGASLEEHTVSTRKQPAARSAKVSAAARAVATAPRA